MPSGGSNLLRLRGHGAITRGFCTPGKSTEAITECEAWKQQAMPEPSMGITRTELVTASHIPEEAIASKDGSEQGMKQLEQFLSAPR